MLSIILLIYSRNLKIFLPLMLVMKVSLAKLICSQLMDHPLNVLYLKLFRFSSEFVVVHMKINNINKFYKILTKNKKVL